MAQCILNKMSLEQKGIKPSGTITIEENGLYDVTNYATADVNVESEKVLLWENPNPSNTFELVQTTMPQSLDSFDYILIRWYFSTTDKTMCETLVSVASITKANAYDTQRNIYYGNHRTAGQGYVRVLGVNSNYTNVDINRCFAYNGTGYANNYCIPYQIYGIVSHDTLPPIAKSSDSIIQESYYYMHGGLTTSVNKKVVAIMVCCESYSGVAESNYEVYITIGGVRHKINSTNGTYSYITGVDKGSQRYHTKISWINNGIYKDEIIESVYSYEGNTGIHTVFNNIVCVE